MSDHYTYCVTWSSEDQEHVGLCAEFPSLSWLATSPDEALDGVRKLVGEALEDTAAAGERPPAGHCRAQSVINYAEPLR